MRGAVIGLFWVLSGVAVWGQSAQGPTNPKAQGTYARAEDAFQHGQNTAALEAFKEADKQDGGKCSDCQAKIVVLAMRANDFKAADAAAQEMILEAQGPQAIAIAHHARGMVLMREAEEEKKKDDLYTQADAEFNQALATYGNFPDAIYSDGMALAHLNRDAAASIKFQRYLAMTTGATVDRRRAQRFAAHPELARERMAPAFAVKTMDGREIVLDDLGGKVVLVNFWSTSCDLCVKAMRHLKMIAATFQGQPLVMLSVSLDPDEAKWKAFVAKNNMAWLQYRDGPKGPVSQLFNVQKLPSTFVIDANGVLQDQQGSIEATLTRLCAQATASANTQKASR